MSTKFQDVNQNSGFGKNFWVYTKFQDLDQIVGFQPIFRFSTKFQDFNQISGFQPNMEIDQACEWCKTFFVSECFYFVRMCNEITLPEAQWTQSTEFKT